MHTRLRAERAATPIAFVRAVLLAFERSGVDSSEVLNAAGIPVSSLSQPSSFVTASQFERLCKLVMQQLDDEALGWFSRRLPWGSYGMLCRASLTAPNLGVALKLWCRHQRLLVEDVTLETTIRGGQATTTIHESSNLGVAREFCFVTLLRAVHGYACWLVDSRIPLVEVGFPFPPPPHEQVYAVLFPGPVKFGVEAAYMTFSERYLSLAVRRGEKELRAMLQHALPLTVRQYRHDRVLASRVRSFLLQHASRSISADSLADQMNVSIRTLHRQLRDEGTSLQTLKNEVRRESAIEQLCRTSWSIKKIAQSNGFASEKTFGRAFKQWTGETPMDYRRRTAQPQV